MQTNLGIVLQSLGENTAALEAYQQAVRIEEQGWGPDHARVGSRLAVVAARYRAMGEVERARSAYLRALSILQQFLPPHHPRIQSIRNELADLSSGSNPESGVKLT